MDERDSEHTVALLVLNLSLSLALARGPFQGESLREKEKKCNVWVCAHGGDPSPSCHPSPLRLSLSHSFPCVFAPGCPSRKSLGLLISEHIKVAQKSVATP